MLEKTITGRRRILDIQYCVKDSDCGVLIVSIDVLFFASSQTTVGHRESSVI